MPDRRKLKIVADLQSQRQVLMERGKRLTVHVHHNLPILRDPNKRSILQVVDISMRIIRVPAEQRIGLYICICAGRRDNIDWRDLQGKGHAVGVQSGGL